MHASSAGEKPAAELDPTVVRVAGELDIDLSDAFPKSVTSEAVEVADLVVTLGEAQLRTTDTPDLQLRHWDQPTLTDRPDDAIRAALVDLDRRTLTLLAELLVTPGTDDVPGESG